MTTYLYTRVSTDSQTTENQDLAAFNAGFKIDKVFSDVISGTIAPMERPAFKEMSELLAEGDTVIVYEISRVGRNTISTLETIQSFADKKVKFRVVTLDSIDLCSPTGRLLVTMMSALAALERDMLVQRIQAGLDRTRSQGTILGNSFALTNPHDIYTIGTMLDAKRSQRYIAESLNISEKTVRTLRDKWILTCKEKDYIKLHEKQLDQRNKG